MNPAVLIEIIGKDEISDALKGASDSLSEFGSKAGESDSILGTLAGTVLGVAAGVVALGGAFTAAAMAGLDAAGNWGKQMDQLQQTLGMTSEEATGFAGAMNTVGMSVEEGGSSLAIFAKNAENTKDTMAQVGSAFSGALDDLRSKNAETLDALSDKHTETASKLEETWVSVMEQASDQFDKITSDLKNKEDQIAQSMGDTLAKAMQSNKDKMADMAKSQAEQIADSQKKIDEDTVNNAQDAETKKQRAIEDLNLSTQEKLKNATTQAERDKINAQEVIDLAKINLDETRALQDIATKKARDEQALQDQKDQNARALADQKAQDDRSYAELESNEQRKADEQIAQAKRSAKEQDDTLQASLDRQFTAYKENQQKETDAYTKAIAKQAEAFDAAQKKLEATASKGATSTPFEKGLEKLGLSINQVIDATGKVNFEPVLEALGKLPEGAQRAQVAMDLFGRQGTKFLDFIDLTKNGFGSMDAMMSKFGLNLTDSQVKALKTYDQSLNTLHMGLDGVATQIGLAVLPAAQAMVTFINTNIIPAVVAWEQGIGPKLTKALQDITTFINVHFMPMLNSLASDIKTGDFSKIPQDIGDIIGQIWRYVQPKLIEFKTDVSNWLSAEMESKEFQDYIAKIGGSLGGALVSGIQAGVATEISTIDWKGMIWSYIQLSFKMTPAGMAAWASQWLGTAIGSGIVGNIPSFDVGGTVPGPIGQPKLIMAHGGETVNQAGHGGGTTITGGLHFHFGSAPSNQLEANQQTDFLVNAMRTRGLAFH